MKRYDVIAGKLVEKTLGEYVDADIAQGLYDALENILNDVNLDIEAIDKVQAQEALKKADKD